MSAKEKVLVALTIYIGTEVIRIFLHSFLPDVASFIARLLSP